MATASTELVPQALTQLTSEEGLLSRREVSAAVLHSPEAAPPEVPVNHEEIARLAYALWLERGQPDGSPDDDWFRAELILKSKHEA